VRATFAQLQLLFAAHTNLTAVPAAMVAGGLQLPWKFDTPQNLRGQAICLKFDAH
jgi:hypothetical protein